MMPTACCEGVSAPGLYVRDKEAYQQVDDLVCDGPMVFVHCEVNTVLGGIGPSTAVLLSPLYF